MTLLQLDAVSVGYQKPVLANISFKVHKGEVLGLSGSNGCGKSTLLKALSGEARVFTGTIAKAPNLNISLQKQHPLRLANFPLSSHEYLRLMAADKAELPARLAVLRHQRVDSLSGGQFQLLSIWACLASSNSHLVLLDEPTNNLDPAGVNLLLTMLSERQPQQGIVLISHDKDFVQQATTRQIDLTHLHCSDV